MCYSSHITHSYFDRSILLIRIDSNILVVIFSVTPGCQAFMHMVGKRGEGWGDFLEHLTILVSWECYNPSPPSVWHRTTETHSFTVMEAGSLISRCLQAWFFLEGLGSTLSLVSLLAAKSHQQSSSRLPCSQHHFTPVSASVFTWPSSL